MSLHLTASTLSPRNTNPFFVEELANGRFAVKDLRDAFIAGTYASRRRAAKHADERNAALTTSILESQARRRAQLHLDDPQDVQDARRAVRYLTKMAAHLAHGQMPVVIADGTVEGTLHAALIAQVEANLAAMETTLAALIAAHA